MHKEILTPEQAALLPIIRWAGKQFGLVGGTAIALHIGHRRSIDFDFFSAEAFDNRDIEKQVKRHAPISSVAIDKSGEYTFVCQGVRMTFYRFPYAIAYPEAWDDVIRLPDLLTLAAMKAFALGRRAKWKDYVDLYFILRDFFPLPDIIKKGKEIFTPEFNEKLFRVQLSYFADVDYTETVDFLPGFAISDATIKKELIRFSLS